MPMNTLKQAVIEMTPAQAKALGAVLSGRITPDTIVKVEETNLGGSTLAVVTKRGTTLVNNAGKVTVLGDRGASSGTVFESEGEKS
jgi:hypothetical protein